MGIQADIFVSKVNGARSGNDAKEAVFKYMNSKLGKIPGDYRPRLAAKFNAARGHFTKHQAAAQQAHDQFMRHPNRTGFEADQLVRAVNGARSETAVQEAVFSYLNSKIDRKLADNGPRLASKFNTTHMRFTQYQTAAQNAYERLSRCPYHVDDYTQHSIKEMARAKVQDIPKLVRRFAYRHVDTSRTSQSNLDALRAWPTRVASRLTANVDEVARAFEACLTFGQVDAWRVYKAEDEERRRQISSDMATFPSVVSPC